MAKKEKKHRLKNLWADFKKFISRGSIIDMAVGVVIGGAFGAIVTSVVNILLSICTWAVPGGLAGLVTVLPAANAGQISPLGLDMNVISATDWANLTAGQQGWYTKHGGSYYYSGLAVIDWGAFINAVIAFLVIALVLFTIVRVFQYLQKKRAEMEAKVQEEYYKKHPEERPTPVEEPAPVVPADVVLLTEIRDLLKKQKPDK